MGSVAVIIPVKNEEKYIARTLESLLNQKKKPDEIMVVLDRCTDNTSGIVKEYASKHGNRIRYVEKHDTKYQRSFPLGFFVAEAVNVGIKNLSSKFDYLMIANGDSVYSDDYIQEAVEIMERDSSCAIIGFKSGTSASIWGTGVVYRHSFLMQATGGYIKECAAEDTYLQFAALGLNWEIRTIENARAKVLRKRGEGNLRYRIRYAVGQGYASYSLGNSFWYVLLRAGYQMYKNRFTAFVIPFGYIYAALTGAERLDSELKGASKEWQKRRIKETLEKI